MTRSTARELAKFVTLLALEGGALCAWFSGASSLFTWLAYGRLLEFFGPAPVAWLTDPLRYVIAGQGYEIEYWCTPTSIWTAGFLMIWAGAPTWTVLLKRAALYAPCTFGALCANLVISVWLDPHMPSWYWAHIPGTVIIYVTAFIACLLWIFRSPPPRRDRELTARRHDDRVLAAPVPAPAR